MQEYPSDSRDFPEFILSRHGQSVLARGRMLAVTEQNALEEALKAGTAVVGIIPFNPNEPAVLRVPEFFEKGEAHAQSTHQFAEPHSVQGRENSGYRHAVAQAVARMNDGEFDKVVLARLLQAHYDEPLNPAHIFESLLVRQPNAYAYSAKIPGTSKYLMGASPELVLRSHDGAFTTHPLAGSIARTEPIGSTEDAQLGEELMHSAKDRAEHATVVQDIQNRLAPVAEKMDVPAVPTLLSTPQLWHLGTRISGQLAQGVSSLGAARAIHPTPAICGFPTEKALEVICELEDFDRGFFGGLIGWMDPAGNGEWALVLRCAEIDSTTATLFAGAGIVKASVPAKEFAETATKLDSFAQVLGFSSL